MPDAPAAITQPALLAEAGEICIACAQACEHALQCDPTAIVGTEPFTYRQLAVVTCASACRITAAAIAEGRPDVLDACTWCVEVALECMAALEPGSTPELSDVRDACLRCARACDAAVDTGGQKALDEVSRAAEARVLGAREHRVANDCARSA